MKHNGGCHCGNIRLAFFSDIDPRLLKIRACQCSFCRKHGARAVSDPDGLLLLRIADREKTISYRFAHRTASFLMCGVCGVPVAAITNGGEKRGIVQVNAITENQSFGHAVAVDYCDESQDERNQRRQKLWMPVTIEAA